MDFSQWFTENLSEFARDISEYGADGGFPHITYTSDCVKVYDRFESDIYEALNSDAEDMGHNNVEEMIAMFGRSDMLSWPEGRKNLLVWYMCEREARSRTY
jgi:hypothetical protein